jgi:hypothetical protein
VLACSCPEIFELDVYQQTINQSLILEEPNLYQFDEEK